MLVCTAASSVNDPAYVPCLLVVEVAGVTISPLAFPVHADSQRSIVKVCAVVSVTVFDRFVYTAVQPKEVGAGLLAILMVSPGAIRAKVAPVVMVFHASAHVEPSLLSFPFS